MHSIIIAFRQKNKSVFYVQAYFLAYTQILYTFYANFANILQAITMAKQYDKKFKCRKPSKTELRCNRIKEDIIDIYNDSHQNYGAPKITKLLRKNGEIISERTVGKYMSSIGIKAQ